MAEQKRAILKITGPDIQKDTIEVTEKGLKIGRLAANDLTLQHQKVSRFHAEVHLTADGLTVQDMGSSNGTQIGDTTIEPEKPYPLKVGDSFQIGPFVLTVDSLSDPSHDAPTPVAQSFKTVVSPSAGKSKLPEVPPEPEPAPQPEPKVEAKAEPEPVVEPAKAEEPAKVDLPREEPSKPAPTIVAEPPKADEEATRLPIVTEPPTGEFPTQPPKHKVPPTEEIAPPPELLAEPVEAQAEAEVEPYIPQKIEEFKPVEPGDAVGDIVAQMPLPPSLPEAFQSIFQLPQDDKPMLPDTPTIPPRSPIVRVSSNGHHPEHIEGIPLDQSHWLEYLPAIYSDDMFTGRFLLIFESVLAPLEWLVDALAYFFDARFAPPEWLQWFGSWVEIMVPSSIPVERQRAIVKELGPLFLTRGTPSALSRHLELVFAVKPEIKEPHAKPSTFEVILKLGKDNPELNRRIAERIIESHRPAHTQYTLTIN